MRGSVHYDQEMITVFSSLLLILTVGTEAVVSKAERRRGVIIGIVLTVVILCIVFIVVFCYRRRLRNLCGGIAERRAAKGNSLFCFTDVCLPRKHLVKFIKCSNRMCQ